MVQMYRAILHLYPAEYRETFATEMIETFEQASRDQRKGLLGSLRFWAIELAGLLGGAISEQKAKRAAPRYYLRSRGLSRRMDGMPREIVAVEDRLEEILQAMEYAIAHHDFPKARFYSNEERTTRERLNRLVSAYEAQAATRAEEIPGTNEYA
jgi:hypothetical protein